MDSTACEAVDSGECNLQALLIVQPFGTVFAPLDLNRDFVLRALREILMHIYAVKRPAHHASYRRAVNSLADDAQGWVRLA